MQSNSAFLCNFSFMWTLTMMSSSKNETADSLTKILLQSYFFLREA